MNGVVVGVDAEAALARINIGNADRDVVLELISLGERGVVLGAAEAAKWTMN